MNLHLLIIMIRMRVVLVVLSSLVMFTICIRPKHCGHRIFSYLSSRFRALLILEDPIQQAGKQN